MFNRPRPWHTGSHQAVPRSTELADEAAGRRVMVPLRLLCSPLFGLYEAGVLLTALFGKKKPTADPGSAKDGVNRENTDE